VSAQSLSAELPPTAPLPNRRRGWTGIAIAGAIVVIASTLCVIAAVSLLRPSAPRTHQVQMLTDVVPLRTFLAEQLRDESRRHHLDIVLTSKQYGALEALDLLDAPNEFKLALIPGGIKARDYPRVRLVTTLTTEPLHVLVRPELAGKGLSALRGKRVSVGPSTTASHHLSREVLAFVGLTPTTEPGADGYLVERISPDDLYRELGRIESLGGTNRSQAILALPDAVMFLAPMPSQLARRLVAIAGYHLLALRIPRRSASIASTHPTPRGSASTARC